MSKTKPRINQSQLISNLQVENEKFREALKIASEEYNKLRFKNLEMENIISELLTRKTTEKIVIVRDNKQYCTFDGCKSEATYKMELKTSTARFCFNHVTEKSSEYAKHHVEHRVSILQ